MTKADIAAVVRAFHGGISRNEATRIVDTILGCVRESLESGGSLRIRDFGVIEVRERQERRGRAVRDGAPLTIPARRAAVFRPSRTLIAFLNEGDGGNPA